ncbi:MAG: hypothetical protein JWR84_1091 [Caulobacter sp.]|nr:hypothetical protein [Caulobacter sp.]
MANFPKIDGPCPYLDRLAEIMDGDHCRMCQRTVTDLTDMSDKARTRFLASCSGEVCVTYRFPMRPAAAAAALAASLVALPVAAQPAQTPVQSPPAAATAAPPAEDDNDISEVIVVSGGRIARPILDMPIKTPTDLKAPVPPPRIQLLPGPSLPDKTPAKPAKGA